MRPIILTLHGQEIEVDRRLYKALLEDSTVHSLAEYQHTLRMQRVPFNTFAALARRAEIPYALFFAPDPIVRANLKRKLDILLTGVKKGTFSMSSRGAVELRDIELIVKDILRKQSLLKTYDKSLKDNQVIESLKRSRKSVKEQADILRNLLGIDLDVVAGLAKEKTFDYIIGLLEAQNIFVSQSTRAYMPQNIQASVKFSGVCIRDKKAPFIFLNNKEEEAIFEPTGRRVLTLILLCVCLARAKFKAVSYNEQSKNVIQDLEFAIAEEILMPKDRFAGIELDSIENIEKAAGIFSVTPSALIMRVRRLGLLDEEACILFLNELRERFRRLPKSQARNPSPVNAFKKYNGVAYARAIMRLVDAGSISRIDAGRVLFMGKAKLSFLDTLRGAL